MRSNIFNGNNDALGLFDLAGILSDHVTRCLAAEVSGQNLYI